MIFNAIRFSVILFEKDLIYLLIFVFVIDSEIKAMLL